MFLMAQKPVPGSNEQALYLTAAVPTNPGPTQLLLEVSLPAVLLVVAWRHVYTVPAERIYPQTEVSDRVVFPPQIRYSPGLPGLKVFTKSSRPDLAPQLFDAVARLLA